MPNVFVYGTLKKGYGNHYRLLKASKPLGPGMTAKRFTMLNSGFPVVFDTKTPTARVLGEVYEVDAQTIQRLDHLEGLGYMYRRDRVLVLTEQGCKSCWMYIGIHKYWRHRLQFLTPVPIIGGGYVWGRPTAAA